MINGIINDKVIIIRGLRRTGKTSLMRVALNEVSYPYIHLDIRFTRRPRQVDLIGLIRRRLEDFQARNRSIINRVGNALSRVR
ncbi:hypothetical protein [Vulcanisaeta sp. JCM 16159]|uniref:hypothetical protein n=1 Tax=Vulcanisaeta sp. JCM 16159 TaxID=1295371 RepID=UPI000AC839E7|nr:hypothetical protein [Vulcanisaeta sp. JCM 16159]